MPGRSRPRSLPQSRIRASSRYSTRIMFLEPPPSIPPRPTIFSRGLSSMTLARGFVGAGLCSAARYWLAIRWASCWLRRWARTAWPRDVVRFVLIGWFEGFLPFCGLPPLGGLPCLGLVLLGMYIPFLSYLRRFNFLDNHRDRCKIVDQRLAHLTVIQRGRRMEQRQIDTALIAFGLAVATTDLQVRQEAIQ